VSRSLPPVTDDHAVQQLHAQALNQLTPATLARLHAARHAPARPARAHGWWLATACSAVLALGLGYSFTAHLPGRPPAPVAVAAVDDSDGLLDENPDMYVWLAATDLAME
jgi:hypothetical protein